METEYQTSQQDMETFFQKLCDDYAKDQSDRVGALCNPQFVACDFDKKIVLLSYHVQDWMKNTRGVMHGGIIATVFDLTMGLLSRFCSGSGSTPTTNIQVTFLRPIPIGETLVIEAFCSISGKTLCAITAKSWFASNPEKLTATASGTYYSGG